MSVRLSVTASNLITLFSSDNSSNRLTSMVPFSEIFTPPLAVQPFTVYPASASGRSLTRMPFVKSSAG